MFTHQQSLATRFPFLVFADDGADGGGGDGAAAGTQDGTPPPAYTPPQSQADLDRIVESRLARERQKLTAEYGGDAATVKQQLEDYQKHLDSQKTDHEKALEAARAEAAGETRTKFLGRIVSSEVKLAATAAGFTDPGDVVAFLNSEELVKDDEPDADAITKAITKLATEKSYLLKVDTKPTPRTRPKPGQGEPTDTSNSGGKGNAASALRQLATRRKNS
ncbi:hypothetical protein AB0E56_13085 [Microbacterium sp. NPDC028030]|uniref:phage scaffolding protein n=1 Tax=Microbacterium sp. NPDC028030 TaxID=3155124 RepID=UPI0033ECFB76